MSKEYTIKDFPVIYNSLKSEISKVVIGQDQVIENLLIAIFAGGHILLEGVPGLGKTLLASTVSRIVGGSYKRIQFTPDLMPSDIIGTTVYSGESSEFIVKKGPVFCNILLADEINRSPAKTQSALLQVMQEKEVTIDGTDYQLDNFFITLATQNPIEMEGTYPLPEAQVDRFFMKLGIEYPSIDNERGILKNYRDGFSPDNLDGCDLNQVISPEAFRVFKELINSVQVDDKIIDYITSIVSKTREYQGIEVGSSPRGSVDLFKASRIIAAISGRDYVIPEDVKDVAFPILRHRIILEVEAEIDGIKPDDTLRKIIDEVDVPR